MTHDIENTPHDTDTGETEPATPDWRTLWAEADREKEARQKEEAHYDSLSMEDLAGDILARCEVRPDDTLETLENRLLKNSLLMDRAFTRSMHDAGLGRGGRLQSDGLHYAIQLQRLMRQTYDSLAKTPQDPAVEKTGKRTREDQKDEQ